jgi:hypothetical protein
MENLAVILQSTAGKLGIKLNLRRISRLSQQLLRFLGIEIIRL